MISFTSGWTVFRLPSTPCSDFTFSVLPLQIASESETWCGDDYPRSPEYKKFLVIYGPRYLRQT